MDRDKFGLRLVNSIFHPVPVGIYFSTSSGSPSALSKMSNQFRLVPESQRRAVLEDLSTCLIIISYSFETEFHGIRAGSIDPKYPPESRQIMNFISTTFIYGKVFDTHVSECISANFKAS